MPFDTAPTLGAANVTNGIWAGIIAFAIMVYVVLDGFDLGIGIRVAKSNAAEDQLILSDIGEFAN